MGATVTLKIQEFSDIKIKTMLKKYLIHSEDVTNLLFNGREDLVSLCRNPFYLVLLINFIMDKGLVLPKNQMELYHGFIEERLKKCADKLEKENMKADDIYQAAKKLSFFMHETEECGLECPTKLLYKNENEEYWRKIFELLRYAKICRFGGQNESISFVHRRFQEFFLVENIIDQKQVIAYENYRNILTDTGMRDALVLYCEVAEEKKAREIANFCWKTIQTNINHANNIHSKESQELICVLYFMKEAFRNRKQVLSDFQKEFYQLVKKILKSKKAQKSNYILTHIVLRKHTKNTNTNDTKVDYIILLAIVNSMVLFSKKQLEKLVLEVFRINNRWLNDVIMQNCRTINTLGYNIENKFINYFGQLNMRIFFKRFSNTRFSLSISPKFRYIRNMHFLTMLFNAACVLTLFPIGALAIMNLIDFILHIDLSKIDIFQIIHKIPNNTNSIQLQPNFIVIILSACFAVFSLLILAIIMRTIRFYPNQTFLILTEAMTILTLMNVNNKMFIIRITTFTIFTISWIIFMAINILIIIHDFKYYVKNFKTIIKVFKKKIVQELILVLLIVIIIFAIIVLIKIFKVLLYLLIACMVVSFIAILVYIVFLGWLYLKDRLWLKRHTIEIKHMKRAHLINNLNSLYFDSIKYKYLESLLLKKVELEGNWTNGTRPQYSDDRVDYALAKLDCTKLDSCDYLF